MKAIALAGLLVFISFLFAMDLPAILRDNDRNVAATTNCGVGAKLIDLARDNKDCDKREASRFMLLMGLEDQGRHQICSLGTSFSTYANLDNCLNYNTVSSEQIASDLRDKSVACTKPTKKKLKKVYNAVREFLFKSHRKCMEKYA